MDYIQFITDYERMHGKSQAEMASLLGIGSYQNYQTLKRAKTISHEVIKRIDDIYAEEHPQPPVAEDNKYLVTLEKLVAKYEAENNSLQEKIGTILSNLNMLEENQTLIAAKAFGNHEVVLRVLAGEKLTYEQMIEMSHTSMISRLGVLTQEGMTSVKGKESKMT